MKELDVWPSSKKIRQSITYNYIVLVSIVLHIVRDYVKEKGIKYAIQRIKWDDVKLFSGIKR